MPAPAATATPPPPGDALIEAAFRLTLAQLATHTDPEPLRDLVTAFLLETAGSDMAIGAAPDVGPDTAARLLRLAGGSGGSGGRLDLAAVVLVSTCSRAHRGRTSTLRSLGP